MISCFDGLDCLTGHGELWAIGTYLGAGREVISVFAAYAVYLCVGFAQQ